MLTSVGDATMVLDTGRAKPSSILEEMSRSCLTPAFSVSPVDNKLWLEKNARFGFLEATSVHRLLRHP